jgi:hypothetical protein
LTQAKIFIGEKVYDSYFLLNFGGMLDTVCEFVENASEF